MSLSGIGVRFRGRNRIATRVGPFWCTRHVTVSKPMPYASELGVLAENVSRYNAVAGLINHARRLCLCFSIRPPPTY